MAMQSFENLLPMTIIVTVFYLANIAAKAVSGGLIIPELINKIVTPGLVGADTVGFNFALHFFMQLFYWFGLHGFAILSGIYLPIATTMLAANMEAWAAGQALPYASAGGLMGGPFNYILPLLLIVACKAQRNKAIGKASIIPGIFGISEPWLFGTPVMLNPILFIPFVLSKPVATAFSVFVIKMGWQNPIHMSVASIPGMIVPVTTYIATDYDWRVFLWWVVGLAIWILLYLPFVIVWDRKCLREEKEMEAAAAAEQE